MNKENLRKKYLELRKNICLSNKDKYNKEIFNRIIKLEEYLNSNLILTYVSLKDEVDTKGLIEYSLKLGKKVAVPKCIDKEMKFYLINSLFDLREGNYGILEPIGEDIVNDFSNSICIVPGICFDKECNRIGYGMRILW